MGPTPGDILKYRYWTRAVLRATGVVLSLVAVAPFVSWALEGWRDGDFLNLSYYAPRIVMCVVFAVLGVALMVFAGLLAKWIAPFARPECPRCGYNVDAHMPERCPECGLALGTATPGSSQHCSHDPSAE